MSEGAVLNDSQANNTPASSLKPFRTETLAISLEANV